MALERIMIEGIAYISVFDFIQSPRSYLKWEPILNKTKDLAVPKLSHG